MDFNRLSIKNFLTVGEAQLDLNGRGLLLIQGENEDDTSAKSNGAGKSSLVDALCWCLYGETARGVTGDAVVNDTAKKDCSVFAMLADGATEYKVERFRKHKTHKNQLYVWQIDPAGGPSIDLSKGTDKETQEVVNKLVGCSLDVFSAAVYSGQEMMPDLPGMTDKQLKLLIEEAAGVEVLAEAYAEARWRSAKVQSDLETVGAVSLSAEANLALLLGQLADTETSAKVFEDGRKDGARAELAKIKPLQTAKDEAQVKIDAFDAPALTARKVELEAQLASHREQEEKLATLNKAERAAGDKVTRFRSTLGVEKAGVERQEKALTEIESQVGKPCGECGKTYCEHDLETAKAMRVDSVTAAKKALREAALGCKAAIEEHGVAQDAVAGFKAIMTDVSAASCELRNIGADLAMVDRFSRALVTLDKDMEAVKVAAKGKLTETNPWTKVLEEQRKRESELRGEISTKALKVADLEEKAELYANAVKVFGPAGVRAHILDTVTPFLNDRTSAYLGALADGNITAIWSTLTKTAKGDMKEKFNIEVVNDKGAKSFAGLSGGEKRKVRLATAMALQDMVASRATKPIGLLICDEVDDAIDEPGLERLMTVLERKAKERGTLVVISHRSLTDWIDQVITVTKSSGFAVASGANLSPSFV